MIIAEWIKEQRKLLDAATPRPWRAYTEDNNSFSEIQVWEKDEHTLTLAVADNHVEEDRENFILMAQAPTSLEKALAIIEELGAAVEYAVQCFEAAEVEGLAKVLYDSEDERLKDLVERRLLYALDKLNQSRARANEIAGGEG